MLLDHDTIAAISTPPGRGAIAIVRVSGEAAFDIGRSIMERWPLSTRHCVLSRVKDPIANTWLDQGILTRFDSGASYTGEKLFEFSGHGGLATPSAVLGVILRSGARHARPGEFTQRAVLNGRMDLVQAESIGDLVDAQTEAQRRIAFSNATGTLSVYAAQLYQHLVELEALIAYDLDFPEEDDGPIPRGRIDSIARDSLTVLKRLLSTRETAEIAKHGAVVVIAGRPNCGKSSLFNALLGEDRAIVTEHEGTTRDAIEVLLDHPEIPLRLVDTAGLRETTDVIERLGIEVSVRHLKDAHLVLVCGDQAEGIEETIQAIRMLGVNAAVMRVRTKADLHPGEADENCQVVSAVTGQGLPELLRSVRDSISAQLDHIELTTPIVTRVRQQIALDEARLELEAFLAAWSTGSVPTVMAVVHVRQAAHALAEMIGKIDVDTILGAVFERFCVGK
ncbi:MAG: tRNA uridine-5-carboxymethylaminomethyl(34) synthesis GTPase MnmE [Gemmatimonadaceae bacterium]